MTDTSWADIDTALQTLAANKHRWAVTPVRERLGYLLRVKEGLMPVAQDWVETASAKKGIAADSPYAGEEWLAGPYAVMAYCNAMLLTLSQVADCGHLKKVPLRTLANGQIAARVMPSSRYDKILQPGVSAEVWMQPGVTEANLRDNTAAAYVKPAPNGKVALVLGAGNVASIAPLDCLHKLLVENQVVILKMNPVNDYLIPFLEPLFGAFIAKGFLRVVRGGVEVGDYLCNHPLVEEIHITGSIAAHDAIVWGSGAGQAANKATGKPKNPRPITSELGGVSPTIVVPGPWSRSDIAFQAEHIASQKLNNAGANCIAAQVLVMSADWSQTPVLVNRIAKVIADLPERAPYYPGTAERIARVSPGIVAKSTNATPVLPFAAGSGAAIETDEVFGPALGVTHLPGKDPEAFLVAAVAYANDTLPGTLGANILIHSDTIAQIGRARFEEILTTLRYGCIAINSWTGAAFTLPAAKWGAFPGHTLVDVQSGIGFVHNSLLFDRPERTVIEAPFRPSRKPPWFVTNRRGAKLGRRLVELQYRPGLRTLLGVIGAAL